MMTPRERAVRLLEDAAVGAVRIKFDRWHGRHDPVAIARMAFERQVRAYERCRHYERRMNP